MLLEARNLKKSFLKGRVRAVQDVSFLIEKGRTLGIVGESGCGKTTLARLVLRLLPADEGEIFFEGRPIGNLSERDIRFYRKKAQIIFQEPFLSFDPRMRIGNSLKEALWIAGTRSGLDQKVEELLSSVGLPPHFASRHPRALSGGECQRAAIARALGVGPELLVCDEAVSSLDSLVRAEILNLLLGLQRERGVSYLFISHDLKVVRHMSDDILVMKEGRVVESGPAQEVLGNPPCKGMGREL